jgi:hypothetical protein
MTPGPSASEFKATFRCFPDVKPETLGLQARLDGETLKWSAFGWYKAPSGEHSSTEMGIALIKRLMDEYKAKQTNQH